MCSWIAASRSKPPSAIDRPLTTPPIDTTAISERPPPMSTIRLPIGSWIGRPAPIAAASGSSTSVTLRPPPANRTASSIARFSTSELIDGHRDQHARLGEARGDRSLHHDLEHPLGDVELGHGAGAQRPDGDDAAGVAADQVPDLVAHRQDLAGAAVQRHHRRLVEHDAVALAIHERVRGAQVDRQIAPHQLPITQCASPETSASFFQMGTSSFRRSMP